MIRIAMLAVVILAAATGQAAAQASEGRLTFGQGARSCGSFTRAQQGLAMQWVAGYLSGSNQDPAEPEALRGTDFDGMMGWIDNYCREHPLATIGEAAIALLAELRSKARRR